MLKQLCSSSSNDGLIAKDFPSKEKGNNGLQILSNFSSRILNTLKCVK